MRKSPLPRHVAGGRLLAGLLWSGGALMLSCDGDPRAIVPLAFPTRVTGSSPLTPGCAGAPQTGILYAGSEVEPFLAVRPGIPDHLVGVWQQDRFGNGGASGILTGVSRDGGRTWTGTSAPLSRCTGGNPLNGGDYERATDPWVAVSPDGTAHQLALVFNDTGGRGVKAMLVSRSRDGGLSWDDPITLQRDTDPDFHVDKGSITADPGRPAFFYAVWDRLTGLTNPDPSLVTGPTWFARTTDGGATWEPARAVYDPGFDAQTIANQIAVLPGGTLVSVMVVITRASSPTPGAEVAAIRSTDAGSSWSRPILVAAYLGIGVVDPKTGQPVRSGGLVPAVAADPATTGRMYVAWQDARFSGGLRDGIALSRSDDAGLTWSPPVQVNRAPLVQAFGPGVAVAASGRVAVSYYDFRTDDPLDRERLLTVHWLATSRDQGATWQEVPAGGPFDLRAAPISGGYFLGDYQGLAPGADSFTPFFAMANSANPANPTDVFAGPAASFAGPAAAFAGLATSSAGPTAAASALAMDGVEQRNRHPLGLMERVLSHREGAPERRPW